MSDSENMFMCSKLDADRPFLENIKILNSPDETRQKGSLIHCWNMSEILLALLHKKLCNAGTSNYQRCY